MKYDHIWKDGHTLAGTSEPDYEIIVRRWDSFQKIIFTEYKQTKRIRAQILGLKVTKGEMERTLRLNNTFTKRINRQKLRIEIGNEDREIWLWPVADRAPMAHSRTQGGVQIDDSKTSYLMNPGVGYTLGGGFHCTTFECIAQIFREGLRPGGGGDRINTFFVPFAPWDDRSKSVLRFRKIDGADLVYIYMTYESLAKFSPRVSADGHILVQQTSPFNSFDAVWHYDWKSGEFYRLMITKGYEQLALSVKGAKKIATIDRFDNLIENVVPDESSPDLNELRKLIDIKSAHQSYSCRLFPTHQDWNDAISLLALTHRPNKEGHRLCPACLCETPAVLAICVICKGYLISHAFKKRVKITIASVPTAEQRSQEDDVKDHVKQTWEKIKIDLTSDDDDDENIEQGDDDVEMKSPPEESQQGNDDAGQKSDTDELKSEKRDFREQDEVDDFLNEEREKAETIEEEGADDANIDIEEYQADEARNVYIAYPAWLNRVEFGSKVLPSEPCTIGDAQPELIKILLLQMGNNILKIYKNFQRNFCETTESGWQQFQRNPQFRLDLDPKVPYLGEDDDGYLIEPTDDQMRELYQQIGNPGSKDDMGEDGFVNAYHGSLIFKKLVTYVLECGYAFSDLQHLFSDESIEPLTRGDTAEEEMKKSTKARDSLDMQSTFVRRVIAGAYKVNAVYFFRNVDFQHTVTLNPVDILCACRPQLRRISVLHLILQNGKQLPRPLLFRLCDAIEEYNRSKKRDGQRPRWGAHMTDAHLVAIADMPTPDDLRRDADVSAKAKATPKPSATPDARSSQSASSTNPSEAAPMPKQTPKPPPWREGKGYGKGSGAPSHRCGDWNYTGRYYGNREWR